jgi:hypothetical protein
VSCIPTHPDFIETPEQLMAKYHLLTQAAKQQAEQNSQSEVQS